MTPFAVLLAACTDPAAPEPKAPTTPADETPPSPPGTTPPVDPPGTPAIDGVNVTEIFPGRSTTLRIDGIDTDWADATPVSFDGEGLTVGEAGADDATTLSLTLTVADDAPFGPQDLH